LETFAGKTGEEKLENNDKASKNIKKADGGN
jgi:hypothetical protein